MQCTLVIATMPFESTHPQSAWSAYVRDAARSVPPLLVRCVGANGAGKSTLLRAALGLHALRAGEQSLSEEAVPFYFAQASDEIEPMRARRVYEACTNRVSLGIER